MLDHEEEVAGILGSTFDNPFPSSLLVSFLPAWIAFFFCLFLVAFSAFGSGTLSALSLLVC
jgi:hypothetical protein